MHRRQRLIFNLGLAVVAGWLAWQLGTEWTQANLRYSALSRAAERSAIPVAATPRREPPPTDEIVAKNLFSADRTNVIAPPEITAEALPPPPVPTVFGTIKLGESYEALMAESGNAAARGLRRVKQGEQFGRYTVVEILDEKVVVEYQGQRTTVDVYQSARSVARPVTRTEIAPQPVVVGTGGGSSPARPPATARSQPSPASARISETQPAQPPPGTPPGVRVFVERNRRRFERDTAFGVQTWYEPLEQ